MFLLFLFRAIPIIDCIIFLLKNYISINQLIAELLLAFSYLTLCIIKCFKKTKLSHMLEKSIHVNFLSKIFSVFHCSYLQCLIMFNFGLLLQPYPKSLLLSYHDQIFCHFFRNEHSQTSCMWLLHILAYLSEKHSLWIFY